jgi:hypothetical protein
MYFGLTIAVFSLHSDKKTKCQVIKLYYERATRDISVPNLTKF